MLRIVPAIISDGALLSTIRLIDSSSSFSVFDARLGIADNSDDKP